MIDHAAIRFFGDIPAAQARARGDRIALRSDDVSITYRELDERVRRTIGFLLAYKAVDCLHTKRMYI